MKKFLFLILAFWITLPFTVAFAQQTKATEAVQQNLQQQVNAWNAGNLEKAMSYYWNSPELLWISRGGTNKGYEPVFKEYQQAYTDRSEMGTYSFEPLYIEELAADKVYFVFRWKIEKEGKKLMGGVSSQVWKKLNGKWQITSEHAS
ncbi:MAG: nuclear transport factor 2 family protein [Hymenobacteraceae bacterium]|nr:nuclear transport factor 2 family protein [Hymenobacteraceae bacterium]